MGTVNPSDVTGPEFWSHLVHHFADAHNVKRQNSAHAWNYVPFEDGMTAEEINTLYRDCGAMFSERFDQLDSFELPIQNDLTELRKAVSNIRVYANDRHDREVLRLLDFITGEIQYMDRNLIAKEQLEKRVSSEYAERIKTAEYNVASSFREVRIILHAFSTLYAYQDCLRQVAFMVLMNYDCGKMALGSEQK